MLYRIVILCLSLAFSGCSASKDQIIVGLPDGTDRVFTKVVMPSGFIGRTTTSLVVDKCAGGDSSKGTCKLEKDTHSMDPSAFAQLSGLVVIGGFITGAAAIFSPSKR